MKSNLLLCAALTVGAGFAAFAGTTETVTFSAVVPSVLELSTSGNSTAVTIVNTDYSSSDAITTEVPNAQTFQVRSNRSWTLSAKSGADEFTFTPAVSGVTRIKPASDLSVRKSGAPTYAALSTSNVPVTTGAMGGVGASGHTFGVDYKLATDITLDPPGTYVLSVIYTLTSP